MRRALFNALLISGIFLFAGCSADTENTVTENVTETVVNEVTENTEVTAETEEISIIEPDNSYIFEDLCKVNEEYDESLGGAPIETIVKDLRKDSYERMVLLSHSVESDTDTVKYKIVPKNLSGKGQQYIICYATFVKENDEWILSENIWDEWVIKKNELNGSNWLVESNGYEDLAKLFKDGSSFDKDGTFYVHFKKNLNIITVKSNDDASVFETKIGTMFGGTVYYLKGNENKTVDFNCIEGTVNDEGKLSFKLESDNGEAYFTPGENSSFVYEKVFKAITSGEDTESGVNVSLLGTLDTIDITSESLFYGEWKKETGSKNGNISPELSWDAVDGAKAYAVMMIDLDDGNFHLHGYALTDSVHLDAGALNEDEYKGPYPPSPHNYTVYVFALKNAVDTGLIIDRQNSSDENLFELLNKDDPGNVISYGSITGSYEYPERVW
ncbi:MAG: hypothetical protein J5515_00280 [Lachnospiraceae bacterium]|nr:hypothetical protein [Lachnospiraceae bacterium]